MRHYMVDPDNEERLLKIPPDVVDAIKAEVETKYADVPAIWSDGYMDALYTVREMVERQRLLPLRKQGRFIITRNTKLWDQRQTWAELGWWDCRESTLAGIDALMKPYKPV